MTCCNKDKKLEAMAHEINDAVDDYFKNEKADALELIFEKQAELLKHLNETKPDSYYFDEERYPFERVNLMMNAMSDEFSEVRAGLEWKHWKNYNESDEDDSCCSTKEVKDPYDQLPDLEATQRQIISNSKLEYLQKEWIDIGHFYIQGAIELGITPKKFLELYLNKNKENQERYDSNY